MSFFKKYILSPFILCWFLSLKWRHDHSAWLIKRIMTKSDVLRIYYNKDQISSLVWSTSSKPSTTFSTSLGELLKIAIMDCSSLKRPLYTAKCMHSLSTKALSSWLWYIWYQWYLISGKKKKQLIGQLCPKLRESIIQMFAAAVFPSRLNIPKYTGDVQNSFQWFNCAALTNISGSHKDKSPHIALKVPQHVGGMCQS